MEWLKWKLGQWLWKLVRPHASPWRERIEDLEADVDNLKYQMSGLEGEVTSLESRVEDVE